MAETQVSGNRRSLKVEVGSQTEMLATSYENEERRVDDLSIFDYRRMRDNDGTVQMILSAIYSLIISAGFTIVDDRDYPVSESDLPKNNLWIIIYCSQRGRAA